jgi:prolyl oligopeptidase
VGANGRTGGKVRKEATMISGKLRHDASGRLLLGSILWIAVGGLLLAPSWVQATDASGPPPTRVEVVRDTLHGVVIEDPYRWLEDQTAPETREWIKAENEYTKSLLSAYKGRDAIEKRLTELMKVDVINTPIARNGRYFFSKRLKDQDLFVIYMREGLTGQDQVLIDPHGLSEDHTTSVNMLDVSDDGAVLAYGVRKGGADEVEVRFLDVDAKKDLQDVLPTSRYFGISLTPDAGGLYYTEFTMAGQRVRYHKMGTEMAADQDIFGEGFGPEKIVASGLSEDGRYLAIVVYHGSAGKQTEVYYKDLENGGPVQAFVNDIEARFDPEIVGDQMLVQTDWNAPNGRILKAPLANPARENWVEIVPESDAVIEGFSAAGGRIFVNYLENVQSRLAIFDIDGKSLGEISFPSLGTVSGMAGRWGENEAFFAFSSFHIPTTIYRYDVATGEKSVWSKLEVPVDSDKIELKQVWYSSKDGTKVPMFLIYEKGLKLDGNNPVILSGYGGFNVSLTPWFSARAVLWVENGGVYAIPNIRGGGEFGEAWHEAAMFEKKQNCFDDFIAAAQWLIDNKYTNADRLACRGGSNGGLLVGAMMTQRPDLFGAVVCTYPLLDMLRYQMFLVARFWVSEYGSSDDPVQFQYLRKYSPYHNVVEGTQYPATLFITGDSDTRVAPLHARKMAALVQAKTGSDKPVLLKYDTETGHSGGMPVEKQIEDSTDEFSFLFWQLGMGK